MALLDVVQWKNEQGEIIYRFPEGAISLGAQLIVMEHQEAVFFREGRALDSFGPGRHVLKTGNVPILEKVVNLPFGGKSPFPAEVYFLNKSEVPNLKWGTKQPIQLLDPKYNIAIPVRAFGNYSIRIQDSKSLLMMAIGTWNAFTTDAIGTALRDQIIIPKLQDLISETMIKQNITILEMAAFLDEIGLAGKAKISEDFTSFGIELVRFALESINVPEEDESVKRLKKALADKAEISIIGSDDYKMKRTFDTMEKAAESEGAGGMMGAGMGFGMGAQMGNIMPGMMSNAASQTTKVKCPHCGSENQGDAKFCSNCGKEVVLSKSCPKCNAKVQATAKFCPECGNSLQESQCPKCGAAAKPGAKFCPECGEKLS